MSAKSRLRPRRWASAAASSARAMRSRPGSQRASSQSASRRSRPSRSSRPAPRTSIARSPSPASHSPRACISKVDGRSRASWSVHGSRQGGSRPSTRSSRACDGTATVKPTPPSTAVRSGVIAAPSTVTATVACGWSSSHRCSLASASAGRAQPSVVHARQPASSILGGAMLGATIGAGPSCSACEPRQAKTPTAIANRLAQQSILERITRRRGSSLESTPDASLHDRPG